MAISQGTMQTLGVLRDITKQNVASKEAEKARGLALAQTRIQADERRIDRMNTRLMRLGEERRANEKEFTQLTGLQASIEKNQTESGIRGTDARSIVQGTKMNAIDKQEQLDSQISEAEQGLSDINKRVAGYHAGMQRLAPEHYQQYRAAGKDKSLYGQAHVTGDELSGLISQIEAGRGGQKLSTEERAGVLKKLEQMGADTFKMLATQESLAQKERAIRANKYRKDQELSVGKFRDQWMQWREGLKGTAETSDLAGDFFARVPGVLSSTRDVVKLADKYLDEVGRIVYEGLDKGLISGDTGDRLADTIDTWKESMDRGDREAARDASAEIARQLQAAGTVENQLDFSNLPFKMDQETQNYVRQLMEGMPIIENYMDTITGNMAMGDELFINRTKRSMYESDKPRTAKEVVEEIREEVEEPVFMEYGLPSVLGQPEKDTLRLGKPKAKGLNLKEALQKIREGEALNDRKNTLFGIDIGL